MSLGVMASNQRCPRLFSLDETVFMCTNDEDDRDDHIEKINSNITASSLFRLAKSPVSSSYGCH